MDKTDLLTIGEVADRSGFPQSALRFYEREGLVRTTRTSGGQRRYERSVLRRLAFIRAARTIGVGLEEVRESAKDISGDPASPDDAEDPAAALDLDNIIAETLAGDLEAKPGQDHRVVAVEGQVSRASAVLRLSRSQR